MAVSQISFYNLPVHKLEGGSAYPCSYYVSADSIPMLSVYQFSEITLVINGTQESHPNYISNDNVLYRYKNGLKLVLDYTLYITFPSSSVDRYNLNWRVRMLDKNGNTIPYFTTTGSTSVNYNPSTSTNVPFAPLYYTAGRVTFPPASGTTPTQEGASALTFASNLYAFYKKHNYSGEHHNLTPTLTYSEFNTEYVELISTRGISSDAEYTAWLGQMFANGDGSVPIDPPAPPSPTPTPGGDPAGSDDTSEPGGGGGNYDDTSDPIDFPDTPTGGALECGALIAHRVSKQTLETIFAKLWDLTLINTWLKSLEDPMDAIVSLHAIPVSPEVINDPNNIYVGNLNMGVSSPLITSQYVEVDCGSLTLSEFWGSALDYSPYTRIEIYLPFIGIRTLKTEDVIKSTLSIKYHVDVLTGDCIAFIKCGISVLYTFNGNCRMSIPLSSKSTDALQKFLVATGLAIAGGSVAVGGGAAAAAATKAPQIAAAGLTSQAANMQAGSLMLSGATNIASTKINVSRSGDIGGSVGLMGEFIPYLIIHRPVQSLAKGYNKFKGYTANLTKKLGDLSGYTEVEHINLQGIPNATADEMAEIKSLLTSGVIF